MGFDSAVKACATLGARIITIYNEEHSVEVPGTELSVTLRFDGSKYQKEESVHTKQRRAKCWIVGCSCRFRSHPSDYDWWRNYTDIMTQQIREGSTNGERTPMAFNICMPSIKDFRRFNSSCSAKNRSPLAPFRYPAALPTEGGTRAGVLPGCPYLDRSSQDALVGFESRTLRFKTICTRSPSFCSFLLFAATSFDSVAQQSDIGAVWVLFKTTNIIVIINSLTSVFNTDASLPYTHDLFERLIVKKRIKVEGKGAYFWCWAHSLMEVRVLRPKTRFLIFSLRINRHQPTRSMILRQWLSNT
ncbi:hypothetical protein T265_15340, partial [Opisthorchis viverrini]